MRPFPLRALKCKEADVFMAGGAERKATHQLPAQSQMAWYWDSPDRMLPTPENPIPSSVLL